MKGIKGLLDSQHAVTGQVSICLRGSDGRIKSREVIKNLVVTVGRQHIADQLAGPVQGPMTHMAIGTGTTVQDAADTALVTELNRKAFASKDQGAGADANKVIYVAEWVAGEGTGQIAEAGIFNALTAGIMLCRTTFGVKDKGTGDSLTLTWTISIAA